MPRIELGGELLEILDCPICGRTVLAENVPATGFLANCGRRLINLLECSRPSPCDREQVAQKVAQ